MAESLKGSLELKVSGSDLDHKVLKCLGFESLTKIYIFDLIWPLMEELSDFKASMSTGTLNLTSKHPWVP